MPSAAAPSSPPQRAVKEGLTFVAPYDDPYTIAGQGTIGDEILRQVSYNTLPWQLHHLGSQQSLCSWLASPSYRMGRCLFFG